MEDLHRFNRVRVNLDGRYKVRPDVVLRECEEVLSSSTMYELEQNLIHTQEKLQSIGVVRSIDATVDASPDGEVCVTITPHDATPNYSLGANCNASGEAAMEMKAEVPCIFGGTTRLSASTRSPSFRWTSAHESSVQLFTPRFTKTWRASCDVLTAKSDLSTTSSYRETLQAVNWTFSRGSHEIHVESYSLRDLHCSLPSASVAIQSVRQRSLKSSLRYTYTRNEPWIRKITMEAAGLWGDVKFLKLDGLVGRSVDLPNSFDCSFNAGGGALVQLDGKESCLQDRFFLGGPSGCSQILKGYAFRGAGPSDKRHHSDEYDAVGGNLFGAAYFSLGRQVTMGSNTSRVFTLPLFVGISFFKLVCERRRGCSESREKC